MIRTYLPHIDIIIVVAILLFIIYRPPRTSGGLMVFIEKHFGDSVGFYILHLGIILIVIGGVYPQVNGVSQVGNSLIIAAMGILKLSSKPPDTPPTPTSFKVDQVESK